MMDKQRRKVGGKEQETAEETPRSEKKEREDVLHHGVEIPLQLMEETMVG